MHWNEIVLNSTTKVFLVVFWRWIHGFNMISIRFFPYEWQIQWKLYPQMRKPRLMVSLYSKFNISVSNLLKWILLYSIIQCLLILNYWMYMPLTSFIYHSHHSDHILHWYIICCHMIYPYTTYILIPLS